MVTSFLLSREIASSISYAEIIPKRRNSCRQALYYCGSPQVISIGSGILGDPEGLFSKNCMFKSKLWGCGWLID